jgi:hypothetical protein
MAVAEKITETLEGTWEEVCRQSSRLYGHRVRVEVFEQEKDTSNLHPYVLRTRALLENIAQNPPSKEEKEQATREVEELKQALNENRKRDGAMPLYETQ